MKYYLDQIAIEVTRKCNMNCAHCLRGDAQNVNIDNSYIDKLLEDVSGIGNVTFTGGEPSLNVDAIEYTLNKCIEMNIPVGSFYVVTNAKANPLPLAIACLKWYAYCDYRDDGVCGISISHDMFHDDIDREHEAILRGLAFFREDKTTDFNKTRLINEGRAANLYHMDKVSQSYRHEEFTYEEWGDEETRIESMIYLSANGEVRTDCDIAYDNYEYTIGNLQNRTLKSMIDEQIVEQLDCLPC